MARGRMAALGLAALAGFLWTRAGEAHKPITSKYTYNDDVFPIFRDQCSRCHVDGGVGPMSLVTYKDAYPWAESIRAELLIEDYPPWHAHMSVTTRQLDILMVWATGGTPEGDRAKTPPAIALKNDWALGPPDLALEMPAPFELAADKLEETQEFTIPTGTTEERWLRAVDVRPGTPAIVRDAVISLKGAAPRAATSRAAPDRVPGTVVAEWMAGRDPLPAADGAAGRLPPGAELILRVHYKKTWKYEGTAVTDRSIVGLYFAPRPPRPSGGGRRGSRGR